MRNSPIAGSFARSPIRAVTTPIPLLRPARAAAAFLFLLLWKETGGQAPVAVRDWVPIEVRDLAMPGYCHARGLRLGGSRDLRLQRLRDQAARWFGIGKNMVSSTLRAGSEAHTTRQSL